ncbi:MAG: hypothetical protein K2X11_11255 [Acetobacteraceae bacterium]|nr:hypothetical protein [Acetobacteraceae bacterium]
MLADCDALMALYEEAVRRRPYPGYADWLQGEMRGIMSLEARVARVAATTPLGRRAKADVALFQLTRHVGEGSIHAIACSALRDVLAADGR